MPQDVSWSNILSPLSHLCPPGPQGAAPRCDAMTSERVRVWGSVWAGDRGPLPRSCWKRHLLTVVATLGLTDRAFQKWLFTQGKLEGSGWEKLAWLVLGRQSPAGFGIHSKFSALVANTRLLTPKGLSEKSLWGHQGRCRARGSGLFVSTEPPGCGEPGTPACRGSNVGNTVCQHTRHKDPKSPLPRGHAAPQSSRGGSADGRGRCGRLTVRGGSSSPGPCTSRRDAVGAPCSGQTRPGHRASPGVSACAGTR